jgi:hypothetical protein
MVAVMHRHAKALLGVLGAILIAVGPAWLIAGRMGTFQGQQVPAVDGTPVDPSIGLNTVRVLKDEAGPQPDGSWSYCGELLRLALAKSAPTDGQMAVELVDLAMEQDRSL